MSAAPPRIWQRAGAVALLIGALLLMAATLSFFAIQRGGVAAPTFALAVGAYTLISRTDEYPDCAPFSAGCLPHPPGALPRFYTIWLVSREDLVRANGSTQERHRSRRIVLIQLVR